MFSNKNAQLIINKWWKTLDLDILILLHIYCSFFNFFFLIKSFAFSLKVIEFMFYYLISHLIPYQANNHVPIK